MYRSLAVLVIGIAVLVAAVPVLALGETSDNASWVARDNFALGVTGNVTLSPIEVNPATVTIDGLEAALTNAITAQTDAITNIVNDIVGIVLVLGLVVLTYWRRIPMLYALAGFALIVFGFSYYSTSTLTSILLVVAGIMTITLTFWDGGKAHG